MHELLATQASLRFPTPVSEYDQRNRTIVKFPEYEVAVLLFQSYESANDHFCRILHMPTIRSLMNTFYLRLNQTETVLPGQAALLLSIFALAAYFYQPSESSNVVTNEEDRVHLSKVLSKGALDVLDYSRRNTSGTLEDIQAHILMSLATFHLDGFSARGRILFATAASLARDLRLHRLDADPESSAEKKTDVRAMIDREAKRRAFWYIASTEWSVYSVAAKTQSNLHLRRLLATIAGPQEGIYFIHPNHITVNLPKDCIGDDVFLGGGNGPIMGPKPNGMTYFLERVRLAHLCREMVDIMPLEASKVKQIPYEQIIALDKKLLDFISSLPFFFRLDAESRKRTEPLETVYPTLPFLRYCITETAHSRRCKLHQRFLLRKSLDPRYAYSRRACLESARAVIEYHKCFSGSVHSWITMARMGTAVHTVHLALVVLVMDLCYNKDEADGPEIKREVKAALQGFADSRHVSPLPGRFLNSLCHILQKHQVQLSDSVISATDPRANSTRDANTSVLNSPDDDQMQITQHGLDEHDPDATIETSFNEFWQDDVRREPNSDLLAWDHLFSALDSHPI